MKKVDKAISLKRQLVAEIIDLNMIIDILSKDLLKIINLSDVKVPENRPFTKWGPLEEKETWFRLSNRIAITTIESILFKLKQIALIICKATNKKLSPEDEEMLNEETSDKAPKYLSTKKNIKFTFEKLAYALELDFELKFDRGWANLLGVIKKRNQLTHPENSKDLRMFVSEHARTALAYEWFQKSVHRLQGELEKNNKYGFRELIFERKSPVKCSK